MSKPIVPRHCPLCTTELKPGFAYGRDRLICPTLGCGYVFWDNPRPVVAAIVEHEGDIVLARNQGWPDNMFGLVTGFLERGELPEEGILREIKEEIGLDGEIVSFIGHYVFEPMNQIITAYHVRAWGNIVIDDELAGIKRVSPDKLRPWPMGTGKAVADWLATRKA
jgi:NADH pyrophosphatase NudC (nudix superfamily)